MKPLDFLSPDFADNPWPVYARLRREAPVWWSDAIQMLCVASHAHVTEVLRRDEFTVEFPFRVSRQAFGETLLDIDGEPHRRQRQALLPLLQARRVEALIGEPAARHADRAIARLEGRGPHEVMAQLACRVPVATICETLGIPEADVPRVFELVAYLTHRLDGNAGSAAQVTRYRNELHDYLRSLPQLGGPLAREAVDRMAGQITPDELLRMAVLLLAAGMETSICSLGNTLVCLLRHPETWAAMAADPAAIPGVVREALRLEPPQHDTVRFARTDTEIGGIPVRAGQAIKVLLASANRDEAAFSEPDRFEPGRRDHGAALSFGAGAHACIGKALATRQLEIVIERMVRAFLEIAPAAGTTPRISGRTFRRPAELLIDVVRR